MAERALALRTMTIAGKRYQRNSFVPLSKLSPKVRRQLIELHRIRIVSNKAKAQQGEEGTDDGMGTSQTAN